MQGHDDSTLSCERLRSASKSKSSEAEAVFVIITTKIPTPLSYHMSNVIYNFQRRYDATHLERTDWLLKVRMNDRVPVSPHRETMHQLNVANLSQPATQLEDTCPRLSRPTC